MLLQYLRLETGIRLAGVMLYEQSLLLYSVGNPFWPPFLSGTSHVFLLNYFIVKVLGECVQSSYPHQGKEARASLSFVMERVNIGLPATFQ